MNILSERVDIAETIDFLGVIVKKYTKEFRLDPSEQNKETETKIFKLEDAFVSYDKSIEHLKNKLVNFSPESASSESFQILQSLASVENQIEYAATIVQMQNNPFGKIKSSVSNGINAACGAIGSLLSHVVSILKGLTGQIWQILSNYINVKEWSLKGGVTSQSLTGFFGITGALELSVTFTP